MSDAAIVAIESSFPNGRSGGISFGDFAGAFYAQRLPDKVASLDSWRDITLEVLELSGEPDIGGLFALMDPELWRHCLPAWMTMVLKHGPEADAVMGSLFVTLDPEASAGMYPEDKFTARTRHLDRSQTQAIVEFSGAIDQRPEFREAAGYDVGKRLVRYWSDRLHEAFPGQEPGTK